MPSPLSQEKVKSIIDLYIDGNSMQAIRSNLKVDYETIVKYLKLNNITIRGNRTHSFNNTFFKCIDSEDKAYWLGFIYADGSVTKTSSKANAPNRLVLNLSAKEIEHLSLFKNTIEAFSSKIVTYIPKETYSENPMCRLYINSVEMCKDLEFLGVIQNKTLKLNFPDIPDHLQRHFIRGYFDGNGSLSLNRNQASFSVTSNPKFLTKMQEILMLQCSLSKTKLLSYPHKKCNVHDLRYGGNKQVFRIFNFLYKDSNVFLKRKYNKFVTTFGCNGLYLHPN